MCFNEQYTHTMSPNITYYWFRNYMATLKKWKNRWSLAGCFFHKIFKIVNQCVQVFRRTISAFFPLISALNCVFMINLLTQCYQKHHNVDLGYISQHWRRWKKSMVFSQWSNVLRGGKGEDTQNPKTLKFRLKKSEWLE